MKKSEAEPTGQADLVERSTPLRTYTDRSEVSSSAKYMLASGWELPAAAVMVAQTDRGFDYDAMGNRLSETVAGVAGTYTPNALNQYTALPGAGAVSYDKNGNLLGDGTRTYAYDGENRLISVTQGGASWTYVYDYLGRRIAKRGTGLAERRYVYDGWNLIAELDSAGAIVRRHVWGLDVSGSLQGAGGVGGLLLTDDGAQLLRVAYDASHNVIGLYGESGALRVVYDYDPFGGHMRAGEATLGAGFPFRYSTKMTDDETGLTYYGHRYYSAKLGRFINRDPIEESGGLNLYGFCGNDGVNRYDYLGMNWLAEVVSSVANAVGSVFGGGDPRNLEVTGSTLVLDAMTVTPEDEDSNDSEETDNDSGVCTEDADLDMMEEVDYYDGPAMFGTNFVGPNNATAPGTSPKDESDNVARGHDDGYFKLGVSGLRGALFSLKAVPADIRLLKESNDVINKFISRETDRFTGKPVGFRTAAEAQAMNVFFSITTSLKIVPYASDKTIEVAIDLVSNGDSYAAKAMGYSYPMPPLPSSLRGSP